MNLSHIVSVSDPKPNQAWIVSVYWELMYTGRMRYGDKTSSEMHTQMHTHSCTYARTCTHTSYRENQVCFVDNDSIRSSAKTM